MAITKKTFVDLETVINAEELNAWQDELIRLDAEKLDSLCAAAPYDATETYAVGALCIKDSALYRCSTAIETPEAWTAAHWTETTLTAEILAAAASAAAKYAPVITDTASGSVASFPDGANGLPVKSLVIQIEPVQAAGTPTPESPLPISGRTGVNVTRTGKNLLPSDSSEYQDGIINSDGIETAQNSYKFLKEYLPIFPDSVYTLSAEKNTTSNLALSIAFYDSDKNFLVRTIAWGPATTTGRVSGAVTSPQNAAYCRLNIWSNSTAGEHFQFELGSTTDYEPYKGNTYNITFPSPDPGTVYGGVLDATNGVLTVTNGHVDMSILGWATQDVEHVFRCNLSVRQYGSDSDGIYGLCDSYSFWGNGSLSVVKNNLQNGQYGFQSTNSGVFVRNDSCTTVEELRSALTDVYLVYPLATPRTYQLTPTAITTLLAHNNFWADCGPVSVEYRADTKLYIDKKLAALVAALS